MPSTAATTSTRTSPSARDTAVMAPIPAAARVVVLVPRSGAVGSLTTPLTRRSAAGGSSRSAPSPVP